MYLSPNLSYFPVPTPLAPSFPSPLTPFLSSPPYLSLPPCLRVPSSSPFHSLPLPLYLLSIPISAYEILFSDAMTGAQIPQGATSFMGEEWASWTLTLGWAVQVRAILRRRRKGEKHCFISILFHSSFTLTLILTRVYLYSPLLHSCGNLSSLSH